MTLSQASAELLRCLPDLMGGRGAVFAVDGTGKVRLHSGCEDGTTFQKVDGSIQPVTPEGRAILTLPIPQDDLQVVATFPAEDAPSTIEVLERLLAVVSECEQLESDMESMNSSSLALLEEVSMLGETLPRLSGGADDEEIAAMGLKALLVAASVERAVYLQYHEYAQVYEVLVHATMDSAGRAKVTPFPGQTIVPADAGLLGQMVSCGEEALLRHVPEGDRLGQQGDLEHLARSQVVAVPVCYESGTRPVRLGILVVMDKRRNSYSYHEHLGSQETKLSLLIASMLGAVLGARKSAELSKELSMAQEIQSQILPARPAEVDGFDLAGDYRTSGEVGGDYFDYLPMKDGRTLVVVADVSGHNLGSGMVMVSARATLRVLTARNSDASRIFSQLGDILHEDLTRHERFITAAAVALEPGSRRIEIVNAGHNDLMLYRADRRIVRRLSSEDTIFGFMPSARYGSRTVNLRAGDCLLVYTDGITEATNDKGEMFGEERLEKVLEKAAGKPASEILQAVFAAVEEFSGRNDRGDDVTAVVIKAPRRRRRAKR